MELKEGMYVRYETLDSIYEITKINKINEYVPQSGQLYLKTDVCVKSNVIKASYNIIDLIEPMDLMYIDISPDNCGGIVVPRIAETLNELDKWKERFSNGSCILKGVVTREQLESNIYRIGE